VNEETGVIDKAVFKAFGCGSAIASSAYATELIKGMHIDEAMTITNNGISPPNLISLT
jgi:NifU-like protein involved in Fe-S cluster formation